MTAALLDYRTAARPPAAERVVVVVLNWCNEADTTLCLRSVLAAARASANADVVPLLVDNGSPDGSGPRLADAFPEVAYLQTGANQGYAGGNNRGMEWARANGADHVVVINNDAVLAPDAIDWLVQTARAAAARGGPVGLVAPKILSRQEPTRLLYAGGTLSLVRGLGVHWREGEPDDAARDLAPGAPISFATGCCFLITRAALERVGGFDESYFAYVEDADLSYRLARAGLALVYEPRARVLHDDPGGRGEPTEFHIVQRDRNRRRFARLRLSPARRVAFACWFYPTRAIHFARYLLRGDRARARAVRRGVFEAL
jgi:GT2 family glycosyltransferase